MWVITHTLSGMALGIVLGGRGVSWWAIVAAALLFHIVLDLVPHWDYVRTDRSALWAVADVAGALAVLVGARLVGGFEWTVVIAGAVSALPDIDILNALWPSKKRIRLFPSHWSGFPHGSAPPLPGILVQVLVAIVSVIVLAAARG